MISIKKHIAATLTATILTAYLTVPATAAETPTIRVSSCSTLEVGEKSVLSSAPAEQNTTVYYSLLLG